MNSVQLTRKTFELVDSFKDLCTKLHSFSKELGSEKVSEKTVFIREQINKDLKRGLNEAEFLAILAEYLYGLERDRQKLLQDNDLLRDELNYINDRLQIADQRVFDLEVLQRQEQFDCEIRAMDELLGRDLEFGDGDVNDKTFEENVTIEVEDYYIDKARIDLVTDSSNCTEITMLSKVATTYFAKCLNDGQFEVAVPLCRRVVKELQSSNADHRNEISIMLEILTKAHRDDEQFGEAAIMLEKALTIYEETLNADNPLIVTTLNNLAQLYSKCDRYAEAEPLCRRALELIKSKTGSSNTDDGNKSDLVQQLNNMAIVYQNQNRYDMAAKHYREALEICKDSSQKEEFTGCVNGTRKRLAGIYLHQKQFKKAELLYKDILRVSNVQDGACSISANNRPIWEVAEEVEALNRNKRRSANDSYHVYNDYQMWYENVKVKFPAVDVAMRKLAFAYRKQGMHYAAKMLEHCCTIQNRKTMKVLDVSSCDTPANNRFPNERLSSSRVSTPRSLCTPRKKGSVRQLFGSTSTPTASSSETELRDVTWSAEVATTKVMNDSEAFSGCEDATKPKRMRL